MYGIINEDWVAKNFINLMEHKGHNRRHIISCGVFNRKLAKDPMKRGSIPGWCKLFSELKISKPFLDINRPLIES